MLTPSDGWRDGLPRTARVEDGSGLGGSKRADSRRRDGTSPSRRAKQEPSARQMRARTDLMEAAGIEPAFVGSQPVVLPLNEAPVLFSVPGI